MEDVRQYFAPVSLQNSGIVLCPFILQFAKVHKIENRYELHTFPEDPNFSFTYTRRFDGTSCRHAGLAMPVALPTLSDRARAACVNGR